jgi:hypothetical protein
LDAFIGGAPPCRLFVVGLSSVCSQLLHIDVKLMEEDVTK